MLNHVQIIAEAGVNHNGSLEMAHQMIEVAASAGADAVKFQTFKAEQLASGFATKASYQARNTGAGDQVTMLRGLELPIAAFADLAAHCREVGVMFMSTPFDMGSAEALISFGMEVIKVASGEITNAPLLKGLAATGKPIILSTGMSDLEEVGRAVEWVKWARSAAGHPSAIQSNLTLLHCTSNYPTPMSSVNLRAMQTMARRFGLPVGYSDHTRGSSVAPVAVGMGAVVIEKHFTLDSKLPGPDHKASLEPDGLNEFVTTIREAQQVLGSPEKTPVESELEVRCAARRSVTLKRALKAGSTLTPLDLTLLRPGDGIEPCALDLVVGRRLKADCMDGKTLHWSDLE